jgi:hypothetical protein
MIDKNGFPDGFRRAPHSEVKPVTDDPHSRSNIPNPDPSEKTNIELRSAIGNVREILHLELGGIQAVINERLNAIEQRLNAGFVEGKQSVVTALAGVTEAGNAQVVKFDVLERRVAALELAVSATGGKAMGGGDMTKGLLQAAATAAAVIAAMATYFSYASHH